jgi:hypothetical protein
MSGSLPKGGKQVEKQVLNHNSSNGQSRECALCTNDIISGSHLSIYGKRKANLRYVSSRDQGCECAFMGNVTHVNPLPKQEKELPCTLVPETVLREKIRLLKREVAVNLLKLE